MTPLSFSTLKLMRLSPAHCKFSLDGGEQPETASMRIGTAAHSMALEDKNRPVVVYTDGKRDERAAKWREFQAQNQGATILIPSEYDKAHGMATALRNHKDALHYLTGMRETPLSWDWLGRACRTRGIDVIGSNKERGVQFITELKTTKCAKPDWFRNEVLRRCYAAQLVWYEQALKVQVPELVIVAVESAPPHPVVVFRLTDRLREQGAKLLRLWMEDFLNCERSDNWPGYAQYVVDLDVPDDAELDFTDLDEAEGF